MSLINLTTTATTTRANTSGSVDQQKTHLFSNAAATPSGGPRKYLPSVVVGTVALGVLVGTTAAGATGTLSAPIAAVGILLGGGTALGGAIKAWQSCTSSQQQPRDGTPINTISDKV